VSGGQSAGVKNVLDRDCDFLDVYYGLSGGQVRTVLSQVSDRPAL
jgi:hypothetical protein